MDLCQGYKPGTRDAIVRSALLGCYCLLISVQHDLFKSATRPSTHTFQNTYKTFKTLYNEKDTTKRLIGQDEVSLLSQGLIQNPNHGYQHLFGFTDGEPLTAMVYYVIHTMAAIRWAIDFAKQPKDYKTLYVKDLCKTIHEAELDATDKEGRQKIHSIFSSGHRKHVNFRNNLVRLYRLVWTLSLLLLIFVHARSSLALRFSWTLAGAHAQRLVVQLTQMPWVL